MPAPDRSPALLGLAILLAGCSSEPKPDADGDTSGTGEADDGGGDGAGDGADGEGDDGGFMEPPDVGEPVVECSTWEQDCPDGDRCIPWTGPNGVGTRCVPVDDDPRQPGDPCTFDTDGVDDCDVGSVCWGVDPNTEIGTCVEMCAGAPATPQCSDPRNECVVASASLPLCLGPCHPLLQDCLDDWGCYRIADAFYCTPDVSGTGGGYGDTCGFANACDPGLICASDAVPGCDETFSCCTNFCDLSSADATASCPDVGVGQECAPFYAPGQAPPGLDDVGVCAVPPE